MKPVRLRRNFAWSFVGTTVYSVVQWLLLVALAKLGSSHIVGEFALILAISAPVYLTVGLNLRVVRATDVRRIWTPKQYYTLRQLLNLVSLVVAMCLGLALGLRGVSILAFLFVCLGKSVETTSLMLYGFFQLRERLDLVARSLLLRAFLGAGGFVTMLALTGELTPACAGMAAGWFVTWLIHDRLQERALQASEAEAMSNDGMMAVDSGGSATVGSLARKAVPLGVDAGVGSVATNLPRYAVYLSLGSSQLGVFATLAYAAQVVSMITGAMGDTVVGRLAKQAELGNVKSFSRLLLKLVAFGLAVTAVTSLAAWLLGAWAIRLVLGEEYVNQPVLILLMLGAGAITMQRSLARGLQAAHKYSSVLLVDTVIMIATLGIAIVLVPTFGMPGAAATLGLGFLAGVTLSMVLILRLLTQMQRHSEEVAAHEDRHPGLTAF